MSKYQSTCRDCDLNAIDGIYYSPSTGETFISGEAKREFDPDKLLFYCKPCYVKKILHRPSDNYLREKCTQCGFYVSNKYGFINGDIVDYHGKKFKIIDKVNRKDGPICKKCILDLRARDIISRLPVNKLKTKCYLCGVTSGQLYTFENDRVYRDFMELRECDRPLTFDRYPVMICEKCLPTNKPYCKTKCELCEKFYPSLTLNGECSNMCDSYISEEELVYEGDHYRWVNGVMPSRYKGINKVCDECVKEIIDNGLIIIDNVN